MPELPKPGESAVSGDRNHREVRDMTSPQGYDGGVPRIKVQDVVTRSCDMDHRPSYAAQKKALETKLGRELTPAEAKALKDSTPAVATPRRAHQQRSRTYGGRNNRSQIAEDAKDLEKARELDDKAMGDGQ